MPPETDVLLSTGRWLLTQDYSFVTVTPATHSRVNARPEAAQARNLRDVFGWSRAFAPELLPGDVRQVLQAGALLDSVPGGLVRSKVRYSTASGLLFAHSAFPTTASSAVFFGPDTYRFVALIEAELARQPLQSDARILDMGCGAGPGGIVAARMAHASQPELVLADINAAALRHAAAGAALAGLERVQFAQGDLFAAVSGEFDFIVANPPYLNDSAQRAYRHGGGKWGGGLSERIVREGLPRLAPGGRLVLYTGAAIADGVDGLKDELERHLQARGWPWSYRELDPDVFGEELDEPAYTDAERIAAVALVVQRPGRVPA